MMKPPFDAVAQVLSRRASRRAALHRLGAGGLAAVGTIGFHGACQAQEATPAPEAGGLPPFHFGLEASKADQFAAGLVRWATKTQFPVLKGMALASERVDPGGLREIHWHGNAHELNYCLRGQGEMAIFSPDGKLETFAISAGSVSFAPMGYAHYIRNTGAEPLRLIVVFTDEQPATFDLSTAMPVVPRDLFAETFGVATSAVPAIANRGDQFAVPLNAQPPAPAAGQSLPPKPYTVNIGQVNPAVFEGGTIHTLGPQDIPELEGVTVWPLHGHARSLREPHWHPNAAELNYCISGTAQIGLTSPSGKEQTFTMGEGDIAFLPLNWFHYIASISDQPLEFLVSSPIPYPSTSTCRRRSARSRHKSSPPASAPTRRPSPPSRTAATSSSLARRAAARQRPRRAVSPRVLSDNPLLPRPAATPLPAGPSATRVIMMHRCMLDRLHVSDPTCRHGNDHGSDMLVSSSSEGSRRPKRAAARWERHVEPFSRGSRHSTYCHNQMTGGDPPMPITHAVKVPADSDLSLRLEAAEASGGSGTGGHG